MARTGHTSRKVSNVNRTLSSWSYFLCLEGTTRFVSGDCRRIAGCGSRCLSRALVDEEKRMRLPVGAVTVILGALFGLGVITPFMGGATVTGFTSTLGRDDTLTGRTEIWAGVLPYVRRAPFLGSGFGVFWTPEIQAEQQIGEAHNGYLEVVLHLGGMGLLLTSMFVLSCGRKFQRILSYDFDWGSLCLCMLLMALLHNITETSINSFTTHLTALVLFLAVAVPAAATRLPCWNISAHASPMAFPQILTSNVV